MNFKKILALLFIIALVICVSACAGSNDNQNNSNNIDNAADTSQNIDDNSEEDTAIDITTLVPQQDLGGFEIRFLTDIVWDWDFGPMHMMFVEEQNGEPVNDAIYLRNAIVEDRLNVKITETVSMNNSAPTLMRRIINAGSDEYDVAIGQSWGMGPLATERMFVNLNEVTGLQLDKPWWDQHSIRDYSIQDHLYFMTGDYNLINNDATWMLYFNKEMTQNLGLPMPYDLVRDGKWTFDRQMEYQKAAAFKISDDPEWTAEDRWGQVTHTQHYSGILVAGGEFLVTRDNRGLPVYGQISERFHNVYEKIIDMLQTPGYSMNVYLNIKGLPADKHATYNFLNNDALFCPEILAHTRRFRQMESDFGVLPHPKYDEAQEGYNSYVLGQVTVTCIPITNINLENTATVIDALGMLSTHTIIPAYYEVSYMGKFFRDEESIDMINIIRNSRMYDIASAYGWANVTSSFEQAAVNAQAITSVIERNESRVNTAIEKTLERFDINY